MNLYIVPYVHVHVHTVHKIIVQMKTMIFRKQVIDEDKRELIRFQEMYLPDGDLHSEGQGRIRRFKWSNIGK